MQLLYTSTRKPGLIGQKSDSSSTNVVSAFAETAVSPGALVVFEGDKKCRLPASKDDLSQAMGIVLSEGFAPKPSSMLSILRAGRVWVEAGSAVTAGSPVYVDFKAGTFSGANNPDNAKFKNACFVSSAQAGDTVELEINLSGGAQ